jgi:myo-inositol 2-dehydrogenase/D-chiro-inositol 1-dehydrogenase
MTAQPRLKLALIGLGRLGAIRARILAFQQPRIELVAACDTKPGAGEWAAANLPPSVQFFEDPEDCMKNSGAQAILISTATATHAPLIIQGLDLGLVSLSKITYLADYGRVLILTNTSTLCVRSPFLSM